jgi:GT2 family glycosyltransferase
VSEYRKEYRVDILVRGWNNLDQTERCIRSVVENTPAPSYQITYVDNGSESWADLEHFMGKRDDQYILLPFNHGSVRAINVGLSLALFSDSEYILLLDNDTEIPAGDTTWLERMISYFDDPQVGAVGATSDYVSGLQNITNLPQREAGMPPVVAPWLISFVLMLRKSAVEQVEFFDERFEPGNYEDIDYCLQLRDAGWKCVVADSVFVQHAGSQTFGRMDFDGLLKTNRAKLIEKWSREKLAVMGVTL